MNLRARQDSRAHRSLSKAMAGIMDLFWERRRVRNASWRGRLMHEQGLARQREATPGRGEPFPLSSIRC